MRDCKFRIRRHYHPHSLDGKHLSIEQIHNKRTWALSKWISGSFHGWFAEYEEFTENAGNSTIGYIEDLKGNMHRVEVDDVKFPQSPK